MTAPDPAEARRLLAALTRALAAVAVLALVFTAVNVTLFATSRGVPWPIAILLDPMVALALAIVLYADSRLAAWGLRPPIWSAALRWFTGTVATLMNTWDSIWPDRQIGWPTAADPAGIVLHGIPTVLLILLTETTAAYRRTVTPLLLGISSADPKTESDSPGPTDHPGQPRSGEPTPAADPFTSPLPACGDVRPALAHDAPNDTPDTDPAPRTATGPPIADLWARAQQIDAAARAETDRPASLWRLRTELRIGPHRARQIRDHLMARSAD